MFQVGHHSSWPPHTHCGTCQANACLYCPGSCTGDLTCMLVVSQLDQETMPHQFKTADLPIVTCTNASSRVQEYVYPFWKDRRPRFAPTLHKFDKPHFSPWRYPLAEHTPLFRMWTAAKTCKFWALSCLLHLAGRPRLAAQLWRGWQAWAPAASLCIQACTSSPAASLPVSSCA